ncbi:MAG: SH3 domain-containing protein [Muribaculum sp.]|nr:SH3 domain-containing protein [Muribaculum sp.]
MKKKMVQFLITAVLAVALMAGCGNKRQETIDTLDQTQDVSGNGGEESGEPESKQEEESQPAVKVEEPVQEPAVKINAKDNIIAWAAMDADLYGGYLADAQVIGTLARDAEVVITGVSSDAKYYEIKNGDGLAYVAVEALTSEKPLGYTVIAMDAVMYVQQSVNTRKGPGTDYEKAGTLSKGQEVKITGQADTGWYQLEDGTFITNSGSYIASTKPGTESASNKTGGTNTGSGTTPPQAGSSVPEQWRNADGTWNYEAMTYIVNGDVALTDEASEYVYNTNPWTMDQWRAYNTWYIAKLDSILSQDTYWCCDDDLTAEFLEACLAYCSEETVVDDQCTRIAENCLEGNEGQGIGQFAGGPTDSGSTPAAEAKSLNSWFPHVFQSAKIGVAAGYKKTTDGTILQASYIVIYF